MLRPLTRAQRWALAGCGLAVVLFSALRFDGPASGYWDTYITAPAMLMTGQRVELTRIDGSPRFEYTLQGKLPDDTYDPSPTGFGIASKDQRIGAAVLFGAPFALFNLAAFRWGFAAAWLVSFLFAFLALRRLTGGFGVPLTGALILVLNPFSLYLDRLNGNLLGLAILCFLFFLLSEERPVWWLAGLVYGLLGGIRNEAIVLAPMMLALMYSKNRAWRGRALDLAAFTGAALLAILPVLLWNRFAYGQMIIHPSQVAHLAGFRPTFAHSFLGAEFEFNGLLNAPFHDRLVRTPHFAFPTMLLWPLVTLRCLGLALAALVPIGVGVLLRERRLEAGVLLYWYLIVLLLFLFQENWEELKMTFLALHLFPLVAFVTAGLRWVLRAWNDWRTWSQVAFAAVILALLAYAAGHLEAPADERWYRRFPHAARNESGLHELPEELRKDWQFFHTRETRAEVVRERRALTRPMPWPQLYRPLHFADGDDLSRMIREPVTRELRTLAVWSYIYE